MSILLQKAELIVLLQSVNSFAYSLGNMLSKSQISFIKSLHQKKYRNANGLFIIEGIKTLTEFLKSDYTIQSIYFTPAYAKAIAALKVGTNINLFELSDTVLEKISTLQTPQGVLAIVKIPNTGFIDFHTLKNKFSLVLDNVQDPGNLGTIIRTADWFGIQHIICSENTVEAYNPKTIQSTMGSLCRVNIVYTSLPDFLAQTSLPVFGALLEGENIYKVKWGNEGLILLGNEGHGISQNLIRKINTPVTIPRIGETESLNVAVSAAIFCSELGRLKF